MYMYSCIFFSFFVSVKVFVVDISVARIKSSNATVSTPLISGTQFTYRRRLDDFWLYERATLYL